MNIFKTLCFCTALMLPLASTAETRGAMALPRSNKDDVRTSTNRVIYEVFVRNFSPEGTLKGVETQVPRLKDLGVDVIWLMPIYTPGEADRWGTYASPYCVKDYKGIDPAYGTAADLRSLVTAIHAAGMEVWLDWVANHTSTDHAWLKSHPEYYGGTPYHPFNWNDVYQLDYSCSGLRTAMIDAMKYWVTEFDIDGFRCDYAEGVPRDFWQQARTEINAVKNIAWLAESGGEGDAALLVAETFDYNYAWAYNDQLIAIGRGSDASSVANASYALRYPADAERYTGKSRMVYLSNHDVVQDKNGTPDRHFGDNVWPMTVLEFTVHGMPLIYNGQEVNYSSGAVSLAEKTPIDWNGNADMTALITKLCELRHTEPALRDGKEQGDLINYCATSSTVYVYERRRGDHSVIVMLNFGGSATTFTVTQTLPGKIYTEAFTGTEYNFAATRTFTLPAHGYAVFTTDGTVGDDPDPEPQETYSIYIDDRSGWDALYLYGWADGCTEVFGGWPGASPSGTATVDGVSYKQFPVPAAYTGTTYNLICNNYAGSQFDLTAVTFDRDYYFYITSTGGAEVGRELPAGRHIYIDNQTGWGDAEVRLYGWANGEEELFGAWPGAASEGTTTIDGTAWLTFTIPTWAYGKTYNLIVNRAAGSQLADYTATLSGDIYITATTSGVTSTDLNVADDSAAPTWYDLQGRPVANPIPGRVYIRVDSRGASKLRL